MIIIKLLKDLVISVQNVQVTIIKTQQVITTLIELLHKSIC